jgi:hypothetical protein
MVPLKKTPFSMRLMVSEVIYFGSLGKIAW